MGNPAFPLTQQVADTIRAHGLDWAQWHYCVNRKGPRLSAFEWSVFARPFLQG